MIDLKKPVAVSELLRETRNKADRWTLGLDLYEWLPRPEQERLDEEYRMSAPIFGMPSLMGYIFGEVARQRMGLREEVVYDAEFSQVERMGAIIVNTIDPDNSDSKISLDTVNIAEDQLDIYQVGSHIVSYRILRAENASAEVDRVLIAGNRIWNAELDLMSAVSDIRRV